MTQEVTTPEMPPQTESGEALGQQTEVVCLTQEGPVHSIPECELGEVEAPVTITVEQLDSVALPQEPEAENFEQA